MKKITLVLSLVLAFSFNIKAQEEKKFVSGNSIIYNMPKGDNVAMHDYGYGVYANFDYNFSEHLVGRFDLGWNQFDGEDEFGIIEIEKQDVWEFSAGVRGRISLFYAEIMGGYFTGFNSWGYKPAVGVRWKNIDLQANYNFVDNREWASIRLGYYWGN